MEMCVYLKMIVAVLQVCAECGQQLNAVGGDFFGIFLLQVSKAHCSIRLTLKRHQRKHLGCITIMIISQYWRCFFNLSVSVNTEFFFNIFFFLIAHFPTLHLDYFCRH